MDSQKIAFSEFEVSLYWEALREGIGLIYLFAAYQFLMGYLKPKLIQSLILYYYHNYIFNVHCNICV